MSGVIYGSGKKMREQILVKASSFLSQAGHLELRNLVFSSLPMYMTTLSLPASIIKEIEKYK